ncbi:hypothetical protein AK830_g6801 [Neonectria ditissima]|uniref:Uncharacterized protein n=1 Tax=Neonectria ditissima TaxID=78410 RepID=A0A0N8H6R8_9HYPO|nr:hypothetical protein AK830_g6801 [Neonectria ditissima]
MPRRNIRSLLKAKRTKPNGPPIISVRNPEHESNALLEPDDTDSVLSMSTTSTSEVVRQYSTAQRRRRFQRRTYLEIDEQMDYEEKVRHGHHLESSAMELDDEGRVIQKLDSSGSEGWADDELSDGKSRKGSQPNSSDGGGEFVSTTVSLCSSAELTTSKDDLKLDGQPFVCTQTCEPLTPNSQTEPESQPLWAHADESGPSRLNAPYMKATNFQLPPGNQAEFSGTSDEMSCA